MAALEERYHRLDAVARSLSRAWDVQFRAEHPEIAEAALQSGTRLVRDRLAIPGSSTPYDLTTAVGRDGARQQLTTRAEVLQRRLTSPDLPDTAMDERVRLTAELQATRSMIEMVRTRTGEADRAFESRYGARIEEARRGARIVVASGGNTLTVDGVSFDLRNANQARRAREALARYADSRTADAGRYALERPGDRRAQLDIDGDRARAVGELQRARVAAGEIAARLEATEREWRQRFAADHGPTIAAAAEEENRRVTWDMGTQQMTVGGRTYDFHRLNGADGTRAAREHFAAEAERIGAEVTRLRGVAGRERDLARALGRLEAVNGHLAVATQRGAARAPVPRGRRPAHADRGGAGIGTSRVTTRAPNTAYVDGRAVDLRNRSARGILQPALVTEVRELEDSFARLRREMRTATAAIATGDPRERPARVREVAALTEQLTGVIARLEAARDLQRRVKELTDNPWIDETRGHLEQLQALSPEPCAGSCRGSRTSARAARRPTRRDCGRRGCSTTSGSVSRISSRSRRSAAPRATASRRSRPTFSSGGGPPRPPSSRISRGCSSRNPRPKRPRPIPRLSRARSSSGSPRSRTG